MQCGRSRSIEMVDNWMLRVTTSVSRIDELTLLILNCLDELTMRARTI